MLGRIKKNHIIAAIVLGVALAGMSLCLASPAWAQDNVFVGDSRVFGLYNSIAAGEDPSKIVPQGQQEIALNSSAASGKLGGTRWRALIGAKLKWLDSKGIPYVDNELDNLSSGDAVIFWIGVNDPSNVVGYAKLINAAAKKWSDAGVRVFVMQLPPIAESQARAYGEQYTNANINKFNTELRKKLSKRVAVIPMTAGDVGLDKFETTDGLHYTDATNAQIYSYVTDYVESQDDDGESDDADTGGIGDAENVGTSEGNATEDKDGDAEATTAAEPEEIPEEAVEEGDPGQDSQPREPDSGGFPLTVLLAVLCLVLSALLAAQVFMTYRWHKSQRALMSSLLKKVDSLSSQVDILEDMLHRQAVSGGKYHGKKIFDDFEDDEDG